MLKYIETIGTLVVFVRQTTMGSAEDEKNVIRIWRLSC
jgi:hypothetical protein